ncbi:hypothetical protein PIB30_061284 [Stylosanthes scabra]|uniref:Uncharacterized protein n=1 Tax=Stylosanthes scabra TaxID=79078 RepID=A0ABU6UNT7_9FABA|nr:hypothetical protein [Stylosanthes scabra]
MLAIAAHLSNYLCKRRPAINLQSRNFSSYSGKDELSIEQEAERKVGWLLKTIFFATAGAAGYHFFPYMDERRIKILEIGGAEELLNMLSTAKDDRTRKAALEALAALSQSDKVLASLHNAGAISIIRSAPNSLEDADVEKFKLSLMKRFQDLRYDLSS